jgi:hypothetical protein
LDLIAYVYPGWEPLIRPAPASRAWMDATPESFAYRCLPLNIANAHGWEVLSPVGFQARWSGGAGVEAVEIRLAEGAEPSRAPVSLFGQGTITFHIEAIIRTPPGWNLWVGGSPNRAKDGIAPLGGVIETDWSPFTFTMNWRFTRPDHWVDFAALEPIAFLFPVERAAIEAFSPRFEPMDADPALRARFEAWSQARDAFQAKVREAPPKIPSDRWQKHYYRGVDVEGVSHVDDHRAKLRLKAFDRSAAPQVPLAPAEDPPEAPRAPPPADPADRLALARREWLLETLERQRLLAPAVAGIERRSGLGTQEFLERYYAAGRPVIVTGELKDWPALTLWTPDYLKARVGGAPVDYQGGRIADAGYERAMPAHRRQAPFDQFIDAIVRTSGNDLYITAYNSVANRAALTPLFTDMRPLGKFLAGGAENGMLWIGPAGTFTPLHYDLTNNFIAQIVGRKRLKIVPASETGRLGEAGHVYSKVRDLDGPLDALEHPRLNGARVFDLELAPGEILFVPFGWWHQVRSLDFSVTATFTNFRWPNDMSATFPAG